MDKKRAKKRLVIIGLTTIVVVIGVPLFLFDGDRVPVPAGKPVYDGDSRGLAATRVVSTLDTPLQRQENVIWCASFLAAWKTLEADIAKEAPSLLGSPAVAHTLNKAPDPRAHIPKESLYVAAGWNNEGIIDQIIKDLAKKFPTKPAPTFPGILPDSFVAYAYLEANVKFSLPYFQNPKPLIFTDLGGVKTELSSFGIPPEDAYAYFELRKQPQILYATRGENFELAECIVDLDRTSTPNQIILALVTPEPTLAEMLSAVEDKIYKGNIGLGPNDVLLVPDIVFRIMHRFAELEGQAFTNSTLKGQRIDVAQQEIQFRLDRSGAELKSEAKHYMSPIPIHYVFDRPFLLQMKERGAEMPYFVMWVENAELLNKWQSSAKPQQGAAADADKPRR